MMKGSGKGNGISRFGFSFRPSGDKGSQGGKAGSQVTSKLSSKFGDPNTSKLTSKVGDTNIKAVNKAGGKVDRQPSNVGQKQDSSGFQQKNSSSNLNHMNGNENNNHAAISTNNTNANNSSRTNGGIENKKPNNESLLVNSPLKGVTAASRLRSPLRRGSPTATKRGCSPTKGKSSSPSVGRKLVSPMASRRGIGRGGLVPKPYKPISTSSTNSSKPLLSLSGGVTSSNESNATTSSTSTAVTTTVVSSTSDVSSHISISRSLSSASTKIATANSNVPIRTNPRASASNLLIGDKLATSAPTSSSVIASSASEVQSQQSLSRLQAISAGFQANSRHDTSTIGNRQNHLTSSRQDYLNSGLGSRLENGGKNSHVRSFVSLPKARHEGFTKPDLEGMRASFFNTTSSTSRLGSFEGSQMTEKSQSNQVGGIPKLSSGGVKMNSTNQLLPVQSKSIEDSTKNQDATVKQSTGVTRVDKVVVSKKEDIKASSTGSGPSLDTLAMIAGLGGLQTCRQRSFRRLPPTPANGPSTNVKATDDLPTRSNILQSSVETSSSTVSDSSGDVATGSKLMCTAESKEENGGVAASSAGTKRKWTKKVQSRPSSTSSTSSDQVDEVEKQEEKPSALDCLEQLKSSTRSVMDQYRPGIRTNPKVSLRRQVLPSIPQEDSDHLSTPDISHEKRKSAEALKRISTSTDVMKSSSDSSNTITSNQSASSNDDVITVVSNKMAASTDENNMASSMEITNQSDGSKMAASYDEIDLDDELIVIETENNSVPEVKLQCANHSASAVLTEKVMNASFHESSPNETESDSGVFTSSYSKYSLDSLQDDKDNQQDHRNKLPIQKSIVKVTESQQLATTCAQSILSGQMYAATSQQSSSTSSQLVSGGHVSSAISHQVGEENSVTTNQQNAIAVGVEGMTKSQEESLESELTSLAHTTGSKFDSDKLMVASTSNFSDMDSMCSSRETSPLQLLDDLLRKTEERNDERRAISSGTVKQNCKKFEKKCTENVQSSPVKSRQPDNTKENMADLQADKNEVLCSVDQSEQDSKVPTSVMTSNDMVKSITSSTSMSSSITETQSASEATTAITDKSASNNQSKTTPSPSSFSDNDKDFLIDDDYKDQPQLTFYDQDDSIEESLFSTLDSLLAGKDESSARDFQTSKETAVTNVNQKTAAGSCHVKHSPAASPRRTATQSGAVHQEMNLRKFSLTNQIRDQVTNEDSERSRLRSRADTLSSLASDDCMMDYECRITDEEDQVEDKVDDKRSMSPRMKETESSAATSRLHATDKTNTTSSPQYTQEYTAEYKPCLSRSSSLTSDEGVIIDRSTHNTLTQDTLEIKFLLLKLRRVLQEVDGSDGGMSSKILESVLTSDTDSSLHEENMDLKRQVTLLQQQVEERDRRLKHLEVEMMSRSGHTPTRNTSTNLKNAAIQTDRLRPVSCGSIAQDGLIRRGTGPALGYVSYSSESSLPTKPPTPARPTPTYSTYSRRLVTKPRPSTPRYQSSVPRSPTTSRLTAKLLDSPSSVSSLKQGIAPAASTTSSVPSAVTPGHSLPGASMTHHNGVDSDRSLRGDSSLPSREARGEARNSPRDARSLERRGQSPGATGGGRHTARRAESPRHSTCKSNLQSSGMQIFSPTSTTVRQNWLNHNILNNNHHSSKGHLSCDSSEASSTSSCSKGTSSRGATASLKQASAECNNCDGCVGASCQVKSGSASMGRSSGKSSILRAISVGRINNKQDKYYSTRDGTLCISLNK